MNHELSAELKLEAALDAVLGHMCVGIQVVVIQSLTAGSYMYDDRNPSIVYASQDVFDRLKELLPNGLGETSKADRASKR